MTTIRRVLFLCTGNYYRSRYAEELFNHLAPAEGLAWRAFSCGAAEKESPHNFGPMSLFAREALAAKGIAPEGDLRNPRSCSLADFDEAQLVVALKEAEHRPLIELRFPEVTNRVIYWHVDDVGFAHPSIALGMIDDHVRELIFDAQVVPVNEQTLAAVITIPEVEILRRGLFKAGCLGRTASSQARAALLAEPRGVRRSAAKFRSDQWL
jgi:protein-tyrosine phosphatase